MKLNEDGSLTIYIQKDSPGAEKEANWLPAPDGPIYLASASTGPRRKPFRSSGERHLETTGARSGAIAAAMFR